MTPFTNPAPSFSFNQFYLIQHFLFCTFSFFLLIFNSTKSKISDYEKKKSFNCQFLFSKKIILLSRHDRKVRMGQLYFMVLQSSVLIVMRPFVPFKM